LGAIVTAKVAARSFMPLGMLTVKAILAMLLASSLSAFRPVASATSRIK
jgi:hypothetical protein